MIDEEQIPKMDPEIKAKWIEALRSGKYKQGHSHLRQRDKETGEERYCCLGVLCDIVEPNSWQDPEDHHDDRTILVYPHHEGKQDYPSNSVFEKASIDLRDYWMSCTTIFGTPTQVCHSIRVQMTCLNDNSPTMTFNEIADWIEENL